MLLLRTIQRSALRPQVIHTCSFLRSTSSTPPRFSIPILSRTIVTSPHLRISSIPAETPTSIPAETPTPIPAETPTPTPTETPTSIPTETPTSIPPPSETPPTVQSDPAPTAYESLALLTALKAQPSKYIVVKIQGFAFLVTPGDKVVLPFHLKDAGVGDILRLTHAVTLGSRDYTMRGSPYIDGRLFECRATLLGETAEPLRKKVKKKRRTRRAKTVKSKHRYSVLMIKELIINDVPPVVAAAAGSSAPA
ncbi:ribosomal protein L21-like protein [Tuber brumale]|nr:ribosomal protein L21-like protein [Tuber brumale]